MFGNLSDISQQETTKRAKDPTTTVLRQPCTVFSALSQKTHLIPISWPQIQTLNNRIYSIFISCTSTQYSSSSATRKPTNDFAGLTSDKACCKGGIYGMTKPIKIIVTEVKTSTWAARRWNSGTLAVRSRCTIRV